RDLVNVNGTLFFSANDGVSGVELWKSDGTAEGTLMVKDIRGGSFGSGPSSLIDMNGILFFVADDGVSGSGVWKSNGTPEGTLAVKSFSTGYSQYISSLLNVNGTLYFSADLRSSGSELWRSDGTPEGTVMVKDIVAGPGASYPSSLTNVSGTLFFTAFDGVSGRELWKSDGTPDGTVAVSDIWLGEEGSSPAHLLPVNGVLYFQANNGLSGAELWKSDGTARGTLMVKDINTSGGNSLPGLRVDVNGTLFFSAYDRIHGFELWKSDGTQEGTVLVKDIQPGSGTQAYYSNPSNLVNVDGTLFFTADDGIHGSELWKSDGTLEGTVMLKDIVPGTGYSTPFNLVNVNGRLFFKVYIGLFNDELWKSDGTPEGTVKVRDLNPGGKSSITDLVNVNGTLFFSASNSTSGTELWRSDGTEEGTVMVKDIVPGYRDSFPSNLMSGNGLLFFTSGQELWKSDGSAEGTVMVKDLALSGWGNIGTLEVIHNNQLFFKAYDPIHGGELWKSDGTEEGTVMVKDINPGNKSTTLNHFVSYNGMLFFLASPDWSSFVELWKTDGTEEGTVMVKRFLPRIDGVLGTEYPRPSELVVFNGRLYFKATGGVAGEELWRSDGTPEGTVLAADIFPGEASSDPYPFVVGNRLFVAARQPDIGVELFVITESQPITSNGSLVAVSPADATITVTMPRSGTPTNVYVEYGVSSALGMSTAVQSIDGMSEQTLTFTLSGLKLGTPYFYQVVATNSVGTHRGEVRTFSTSDIASVTVESGAQAPGAGEPDGPPAGTVIQRFGTPAISDARKLAAKVTLTSGRKLLGGIYVREEDGSAALPAVQNGTVPGVANGVFKSLRDPQLSPGGALAFTARIKGRRIGSANDEGLWSDVFGTGLEPVLREGNEAPGMEGAVLKAVPSFSLRDGELLASVTLTHGKGGVTPRNDTALLRIKATGTTVLLREGDSFEHGTAPSSKITRISVLRPAAGSPGHGRWHADDSQGVAKITLANQKEVVVRWNEEGGIAPVLTTGSEAADGVQLREIGLPGIGRDGSGVATYGLLKTGVGGVSKADDEVLVYSTDETPFQVVAREEMTAPGMAGVTFNGFLDPVTGASGELAFLATLKGSGIRPSSQSSLWWGNGNGIELVAQQGTAATDENGVTVPERTWSKFLSHALPAGPDAGPLFVAKVQGKGIDANNNLGLWAVDSQGLLRELVRTGAQIDSETGIKVLKHFSLLTAPAGSFGATRSFNSTRSVDVVLV
ncbi:MAG: hypothetical protein EOP84_05830, partial [Verrucomicrobiaceae bacterium]